MVSEYIYKPIKEFKYQTELASYILEQTKGVNNL